MRKAADADSFQRMLPASISSFDPTKNNSLFNKIIEKSSVTF